MLRCKHDNRGFRTIILLMILDALEPLVGVRKLKVHCAVVDHGVASPVFRQLHLLDDRVIVVCGSQGSKSAQTSSMQQAALLSEHTTGVAFHERSALGPPPTAMFSLLLDDEQCVSVAQVRDPCEHQR